MGLLDNNYALITSTTRMIGTIVPDCTFEEQHSDRVAITENPVETGAAITDHAFRMPSEVTMKIGFSNSTAKTEGWVQQAYALMLNLQQQRQPFNVWTGKRQYSNMLVSDLSVTTDQATEWALMLTVGLREIIIVSTQQSGSASTSATSPAADQSDQAAPQSTAVITDAGTVQLGSADGQPTFAQTLSSQSGTAGQNFSTISGGNGFSSGFTTSAEDGFATDYPYGETAIPGTAAGA